MSALGRIIYEIGIAVNVRQLVTRCGVNAPFC